MYYSVFLSDGIPKLEQRIGEIEFRANKPYHMKFISIGGGFSGIEIIIEFDEDISNIKLSDARVHYYSGKEEVYRTIAFVKDNKLLKATADFLEIRQGVNPKSAVLKGKKRADEEERHGFWLSFYPECNKDTLLKATLTVKSGSTEMIKINL